MVEELNHSHMFNLTHLCYGVNPGGKFTGEGVEDERVWSTTGWRADYE